MGHRLNTKAFGFALGTASAVAYAACVFVMLTTPKDVVIRFFNSLMHGVDVTPIMRWEMPWWEMFVGVTEIFILGWLWGALVAVLYNLATKKETNSGA